MVALTLPDFDAYKYTIAVQPTSTGVLAWPKLQECERRLVVYQAIERVNNPGLAQHRTLLNDSVNAFLMSFEATIQILKEQMQPGPRNLQFDTWLHSQPEHNIPVKGLRTLRHFEAHIEGQRAESSIVINLPIVRTWRLRQLNDGELARLKRPVLELADLPSWNSLVSQEPIEGIFRSGISNLRLILERAETFI